MEGFGFSDASSAVRKKRSNTSRRPRNDSQIPSDYHDISSLSSTPPSDTNVLKYEDGGFADSDEASNNGSFRGSTEQRHSRLGSTRCSEGVLAPANWRNTGSSARFGVATDGTGNENKVKKVKLKVGGMIRTINATSDGASAVGSSSTKSSRYPDFQQKMIEDNLDNNGSITSDKESYLQGDPWKDFSRSGLSVGKPDGKKGSMVDENPYSKKRDKNETVRKSKRVTKKSRSQGLLDDEDEDDEEIRYLEKVKTSKALADYHVESEDEEGCSRKQRKISKVLKRNINDPYDIDVGDLGSSRNVKVVGKSKPGRPSEDTDYTEEEEPASDGDPKIKRKKARKELVDLLGDSKQEMTITTRQRALHTGKDMPSSRGIVFPNGLPPAPTKKQKEKLSEVEQQLKRAEALQRRRMQVEKAARESEAEAIRKILGQDSSRKKREDKIKKRQEELAREKAANAMILTAGHVRWVMGPSGTVVTFPNEVGLPSLFDSKPCSYPPPREKCAGPSCNNPYKYRDSKSKLPLCSLQCYRAIHEEMQPVTAC
uniref:INO80 complex subunit B-like conserved region domain-containing protein n=2 Tax=Rhizophora mucronata TaxID=61149 RepID=A0A2P2IPX7_RHIMU